MEIENFLKLETILAFATFILPGFLIMKIIRLKVPNKDFLLKDMLFEAFSYSLLNLAFFGWLPYWVLFNECAIQWIVFAFFFVLVVSPVFIAMGYIKVVSSKIFRRNFDIQMPTAWDWYFSQRPNAMMLIKMKDGAEIVGYFGTESYATSYPNEGSIYLEKVYVQSEDGLSLVPNSNGILIAKNLYTTIEFYLEGDADE